MVFGKLDTYVQKNETKLPSYATHKNKFKMDKRLICWTQNHNNIEENIGSKILDIAHSNILSAISSDKRNKT